MTGQELQKARKGLRDNVNESFHQLLPCLHQWSLWKGICSASSTDVLLAFNHLNHSLLQLWPVASSLNACFGMFP